MYGILTEETLRNKGEVAVLGEVLLEEDNIFLIGTDSCKVLLYFAEEDEEQKHSLSEYEGERVIVYGEVENSRIKVVGHSTFKKPLDMDLYRKALEEVNKHKGLFSKETEEGL